MSETNFQLAVVAAALTDDLKAAPRLARQAGFAGTQFDAYSSALNIPSLSTTGRREFRHSLSAQNQQLASLRADLGPKGFGRGADVDRLLDQLERVLEAAAGLQAPLVCVDLGDLPPPPREKRIKPKVTPEQAGLIFVPPTLMAAPAPEIIDHEIPPCIDPVFLSQVDAAMADLGARADRYNVVVAFRSDLASFAALERTILRSSCPWFGVDLDPVAILRDDWPADEIFSRLGPLVRHVRGRDAAAGADKRTRAAMIGQGNTNWNELLTNLRETDYRGWITIDPMELADRSASAIAGRKYLEKAFLPRA